MRVNFVLWRWCCSGLSGNKLSGVIPSELGEMGHWYHLSINLYVSGVVTSLRARASVAHLLCAFFLSFPLCVAVNWREMS